MWVAVTQTGVAPEQPTPATQPTQLPIATSHTAVAPAHSALFEAEQAPHAPLGWQAGVVPPHWASAVHARQARVVPSHTGVVPAQSAAATQPTQVPVAIAHTGVAPPQAALFVAEHAPHAPLG